MKNKKVKECLSNLVGWRQHYDVEDVEINEELQVSESGVFYQELHPALRLDIIKVCLPNNRDLNEYLEEVESSAIISVLNDLSNVKQVQDAGRELVANDVIYNSMGWVKDVVVNESRFVGVRFIVSHEIGLEAFINRFALQFTHAQKDLKVYLFHSHREEAVATFNHTTDKGGRFNWQEIQTALTADESELTGGVYFLGYYQDDIKGQAIKYKKLNWRTGFCGTCDGGTNQTRYKSISKYVQMSPFYVPSPSLSNDKNLMFDPYAIMETDENNWGFNFNVSIKCDLSTFWCDNRQVLKKLIGLEVTKRVLKGIQFSTEQNHIEEQLKMYIIRDLEGDKATNYINIERKYEIALKAVNLTSSNVASVCLPCVKENKGGGLRYTVN